MDLIDLFLGIPNPTPEDWTESDTRAQIIDPALSCLGWSPNEIKREPYAGWNDSKGYIDYLLLIDGRPMVVIEAKKSVRQFRIPDRLASQRATTYRKLRATASEDLVEALDQCLRYAQHTGALYACATNGTDWIVFKPSHPFRTLPDAKVIIFHGISQITKRVTEFYNILSPAGVQEGFTEKELLGRDIQVPTFSKRLQDAFPYKGDLTFEEEEYSNILDQILKHYIIELTDESDFQECYIPAKGNRATSGTLEALIAGRIEALKGTSSQEPLDFGSDVISKPPLPHIASGRTVVLHGEVGVGKTSFLRYCKQTLTENGKLDDAVWARIDLLPFQDRPFVPDNVKEMLNLICKCIQREVSAATDNMNGNFDPDAWDHLRDIYNAEVRKFQKARYPNSDDSDNEFLDEARRYVWEISTQDPQEHLVRVIRWLTVNCRLPVVIALDNSDQLGLPFQEFLYKLSETLQSSSSAVIILVVRTEALASHVIREHSIASVREQFLVQKAPLATILDRRFQNILSKLPKAYVGSPDKAARDRISVLMDTLKYEADLGSAAFQLVEAAGNGSLRDSLRAISAIFRSSPRAMDKLVFDQHEKGKARLTVTQVLRAMMREDLGHDDSNKLVPNVFCVDSQITMPYSLGVRELQQVRSKTADTEYTVASLLNDFSLAGTDRTVAERTLSRMRADRFVAVTHMLPELRDTDTINITRLGVALLDIILSESSYFSRAAFNTYIYRKDVYNNMKSAWTSDAPEYRLKFEAIGRHFVEMIVDDDSEFLSRIDASLLEPVVSMRLPGLLGENISNRGKGVTDLNPTD